MFDVYQYGQMLRDNLRVEAYGRALQAAVRPGDVVLDLGAGIGFFALLACRLGAQRVYAIEPSPAIRLGPELARHNGFEGKIEFLEDTAANVTLPERVDVIVSDLRGSLPLYADHLDVIADVRRRMLRPGGILIPGRDHLLCALVHAPDLHARQVDVWNIRQGVDLSPVGPFACASTRTVKLKREQVVGSPQHWATVDYAEARREAVRGEVFFAVAADAVAHGLALWFETELAGGISFSAAPGAGAEVYGQVFLPFRHALELHAGENLDAELVATPVPADYVWTWHVRVTRAGRVMKDFRQTTAFPVPLDAAALAGQAAR